MLTPDDVKHIAKLAKIKLSEDELTEFSGQLSQVLDFFGQLQEVNTDDVEETSQVTGLDNMTREDIVESVDYMDELLECTPHEVENHSVKIPKIM